MGKCSRPLNWEKDGEWINLWKNMQNKTDFPNLWPICIFFLGGGILEGGEIRRSKPIPLPI